jgi:L-threonylcarbamoyladenylate synthase
VIVHVADAGQAAKLASSWPGVAAVLAKRFWPGPLTIVVPVEVGVPLNVTAGTGFVGLRVPRHPLALRLLAESGRPIAAPSANLSEAVSPTTSEHVRRAFPEVPVVDGGPCGVGLESTVVRVEGRTVTLLRPGAVTADDLRRVLGEAGELIGGDGEAASASPGRRPRHYAPTSPAFRFRREDRAAVAAWLAANEASVLLCPSEKSPTIRGEHVKIMPSDPAAYGRYFYAVLRRLDEAGRPILIEEVPPGAAWDAARDRIFRATQRWEVLQV